MELEDSRSPRKSWSLWVPCQQWKGFSFTADRKRAHSWQSLQKKTLINTCHLCQSQGIPTVTGLCRFPFCPLTTGPWILISPGQKKVSVPMPGFERQQKEQGSVCRALGAPRCSSQDKGHCSDKQQAVINYKQLIGLLGQAWEDHNPKKKKKTQTIWEGINTWMPERQ